LPNKLTSPGSIRADMFQSASVPPHSFDFPNDEIKNYK